MSHIFISYSHQDSEYAHLLASSLEQSGFTVWIDDRSDYGTQWSHIVQDKLDSCSAFIVIMTSHSYQSIWVQNELNYSIGNKPIFPLLLPQVSGSMKSLVKVEEASIDEDANGVIRRNGRQALSNGSD